MNYTIAENPDALLKAMQEHEKAIARLYQAYAERFDEYTDFWSGLANEELKHAACLSSLRLQLKGNPDFIIIKRFSADAIDFSIRYVNELIERTKDPEFELINAFSLAVKLEEALLEKNFFEVLDDDTQEVKDTLSFLANETERHSQTIFNTLNEYKKQAIHRRTNAPPY